MNWTDYREALGIGFSDKEKFKMLKNKINLFIRKMEKDKCYSYLAFDKYLSMVGELTMIRDHYSALINSLGSSDNTIELISKYIAFCNTFSLSSDYIDSLRKYTKESIIKVLAGYLNELKIGFEIKQDDDGYFIFPKGAKELDDALVSMPLEWLKAYPKAHKTYCVALRQYSEGNYIRDTADNLRKALETFLQEFLGNNENLKNNKENICRFLGQAGVSADISGLYHTIINVYKNYNDKDVKHNDNVDKNILEFLLYQTGVLIRMVIVVKNSLAE